MKKRVKKWDKELRLAHSRRRRKLREDSQQLLDAIAQLLKKSPGFYAEFSCPPMEVPSTDGIFRELAAGPVTTVRIEIRNAPAA